MFSSIHPNTHIALRLPSGLVKVVELAPNTNIYLGKFGTVNTNLIIGRPYYATYELLEKEEGRSRTELRIVPAAELHAEILGNDYALANDVDDNNEADAEHSGFDIVGDDGKVIMRNNRLTVDDASRQALTMAEIEELKKAGTGSGKEIIAKIMASHNAIDEKTSFSLAKYTLRKSKKYLKRFTALPLDVGTLTEYVLEKEAYKIMELREDLLGLICSWANVHCGATSRVLTAANGVSQVGGGRWLVVDDTGGLVTAALAERMGLLYPYEDHDESDASEDQDPAPRMSGQALNCPPNQTSQPAQNGTDTAMPDAPPATSNPLANPPLPRKAPRPHISQMSALTNTLTVIHANNQPNLSLLNYFSYDYGSPAPSHPLYKHLKSLSWLSLLHPSEDPVYSEPELLPDATLAAMKSSKRGNYYKKRRRWERTKRVVDETRAGGFDGLIVATTMEIPSVLRECIPLIRGGGRVVVYNPNVEPLAEVCDLYSKERRAAFIARQFGPGPAQNAAQQVNGKRRAHVKIDDEEFERTTDSGVHEDDFPVNPTLLLGPSLQTARARQWQVLPERTHPMMTSRGGAEGYVFTATRVLPVEGRVEARGHAKKKRKVVDEDA